MDIKEVRKLVDERAKEMYQRGTKKHVCSRDDVAWNVLDFCLEPESIGLFVCFGILGLVPYENRSMDSIAEAVRDGGAVVVVAWVGNGRDMMRGIHHVFASKSFDKHFRSLFVGVEREVLIRGHRDKRLVLYTGYKGRVPHAVEDEPAEVADAVTEEEQEAENAEVAEGGKTNETL